MSAVVLSLARSPEAVLDIPTNAWGKQGSPVTAAAALLSPVCFLSTNKKIWTLRSVSMHKFIADEYGALNLIFLSFREKI